MEKAAHATDWITLILLSTVLLIGLLHYHYPKRFLAFIRLPLSNSYFNEFQQDKSRPVWFNFLTEVVMVAGLSLFIFEIARTDLHDEAAQGLVLFVKILMAILFFITLQRFFHSLTGVLFDMKKNFDLFVLIKDSHMRWSAPILLILTAFLVYAPVQSTPLIIIGLVVLSLLYISGITRASLIVRSKNLNGLQLFFYLCALELLPVLVLVKLVA